MTALHTAGRASALPLDLIAQAVPKLTRHELAALTERLIERLDEVEGDADLEDALDTEDDVLTPWRARFHDGPGCPIADAGGQCDEDDMNTDLSRLMSHGSWCPLSEMEPNEVNAETF